jgi:hypothetical protein
VPVAWQLLTCGLAPRSRGWPRRRTTPRKCAFSGSRTPPPATVQGGCGLSDEWSPDAVRVAHRFVEHGQQAEGETDWVPPRLRLVGDVGHLVPAVDLTTELSERLGDLQPFERRMPGSVRGELVGLNVFRGNRASLRLPNRRIVRVGFETSLRADLKDALYQQVELRGLVKQDGDGRVFHVRADDVEVLVKPDLRWADPFRDRPGLHGRPHDGGVLGGEPWRGLTRCGPLVVGLRVGRPLQSYHSRRERLRTQAPQPQPATRR